MTEDQFIGYLDNRGLKHLLQNYIATKMETNGAVEKANEYTDKKVAELVNGAPEALDTLNELAAALDNNAEIVDVLYEAIGKKANTDSLATVAVSGDYTDLINKPVAATNTTTGLMSSTDKKKLDGIDLTKYVPNERKINGGTGIQLYTAAGDKADSLTLSNNITIGHAYPEFEGETPSLDYIHSIKRDAFGHVTGYTNSSFPTASSTKLGMVKTGYTTDKNKKNYQVNIDSSGNLFVNVPWTDTTFNSDDYVPVTRQLNSGKGIQLSVEGNEIAEATLNKNITISHYTPTLTETRPLDYLKAVNRDELGHIIGYTYGSFPIASSTGLGMVKIGYIQEDKNYPVKLDKDGKMYVNVPWEKGSSDISGTVQIKQGGTGATTANGACENIGAVKKSGDTMTGDLIAPTTYAKGTYPTHGYMNAGGTPVVLMQVDTNNHRLAIHQKRGGASVWDSNEAYFLPAPNLDQTATVAYDILTSKNPVTIAQGGTGATNAATARTNLGITPANIGAVPTTRKVNSKALSGDITLSATDVGALPTSGGTLSGSLHLSYTTNATMDATTTNPQIIFSEAGAGQRVALVYTSYNNYRAPAGLKILGLDSESMGAWFEVDGDIYERGTALSTKYAAKTHTHSYSDITNPPTIPTTMAWNSITGKPSTFTPAAHTQDWSTITNKPTIPPAYSLPTATSSTLGGVKIGSGISISSGTISVNLTKNMVTTALGYTPPTTDTNTTYSAGTGITINNNQISIDYATAAVSRSKVPYINSDGVMEIGRFVDFHHGNNPEGPDFSARLQVQNSQGGNTLTLPKGKSTAGKEGFLVCGTSDLEIAVASSLPSTVVVGQLLFVYSN